VVLAVLAAALLLMLGIAARLIFDRNGLSWASALARLLVRLAGQGHPTRRTEWLADVLYLQNHDHTGLWGAAGYLAGAPWLTLRQALIRAAAGQTVWHTSTYGGAVAFGLVHILAAALSAILIHGLTVGPNVWLLLPLASVLGLGLAVGLAVALGRQLHSLAVALGVGFILGLPVGLAFWSGLGPDFAPGVGLAVEVTVVLAYALANRLSVGLFYGLGLCLAYGLGTLAYRPPALDVALFEMLALPVAALAAQLGAALASRLVFSR
jgi:hypothetical protein